MVLTKRNPNSNIYNLGENKMRAIIGGIPNIDDGSGKLKPFDNDLNVITSHPTVKYILKQGPFLTVDFTVPVATTLGGRLRSAGRTRGRA